MKRALLVLTLDLFAVAGVNCHVTLPDCYTTYWSESLKAGFDPPAGYTLDYESIGSAGNGDVSFRLSAGASSCHLSVWGYAGATNTLQSRAAAARQAISGTILSDTATTLKNGAAGWLLAHQTTDGRIYVQTMLVANGGFVYDLYATGIPSEGTNDLNSLVATCRTLCVEGAL